MVFVWLFIWPMAINAQQLEVGVGITTPLITSMSTYSNPNFYFADDVNFNYQLQSNKNLTNDRLLGPTAYVAYHFSPKVALKYTASFISVSKKDIVLISNNYTTGTEYPVRYRFNFINQSMELLYTPKRTREVMPYLGIGAEWRINTSLEETSARDEEDLLKNQHPRGKIVDAQIKSFVNSHMAWRVSVGFEYYIFNVNCAYSSSIGAIDHFVYSKYYKQLNMFSLTASMRLFHKYHKSKKYKRGV